MGVDISLHIEIRRREKWQLMVIESPLLEKNNEFPIFDTEVYNCRYYHFREFLNESDTKVDEDRLNRYEETNSIEQMYEDFMWDYGCLFGFRDRVRALTSIGCSSISDSDIRIFYLVC